MKTLIDLLMDSATRYGNQTALSTRRGLREENWTYQRLWQAAQAIADHLVTNGGFNPGDRVLVHAPNSPELVAAYFGTMLARLILVPLDPSSTPDFIKRVIEKTEARAIIASKQISETVSLRSICLADLPPENEPATQLVDEPSPDDVAEIVFTSGTTGNPKGVILTHRNIVANLLSAAAIMPKNRNYRFLSLLPLSHMLEQTVGLYLPLYYGASVHYPLSRQSSVIFKALQKQRISTMVVVPQVLKVMIEGIENKVRSCGKGSRWQTAQRLADHLPMATRRWLFSKVHRGLGGRLDFFICGGADLPLQVAQSWERLGIKIVEGYGATECAPIVAGNCLRDRVHGSVGRPVSGVSVRLSDEGEILVKGNNVTRGYWRDPRATAAAFTADGWYRSGDRAEVNDSGRLYLKGRLNDLIVLSNGLNVYPEDVERALNEEEPVRDCVVFGRADDDGHMRLEAAIRPAESDGSTNEINQRLETAVRSANTRLASHQRITHFTIWGGDDFPRTNLLKVKRHEVRAQLSKDKRTQPTAQQSGDTHNDTLTQVRRILSRLTQINPCEITLASDLDLDLGLDSLARVELTVLVEEEFGAELDEKGLTEVKTVGQLIELIERREGDSNAIHFPTWALKRTPCFLRATIQRVGVFPLHSLLCRSFKIEGRENLENLKLPALFVANHTSHVDTPSILRALPGRIRRHLAVAAAADYFFRNRALSIAVPLMLNTFPLSRKGAVRASLEYCGELVDGGWSILIYPEGTRSTTGHLQPFKNGIGLLATGLQVPVVPIGVQGGFQILPKGHRFPRRSPVKVRFGTPIEVPRNADNLTTVSILENAVADLIYREKSEVQSMVTTRTDDLPIEPEYT